MILQNRANSKSDFASNFANRPSGHFEADGETVVFLITQPLLGSAAISKFQRKKDIISPTF